MTKFPLPDEAVSMHTAVLGKTGSGKTSTAKLIIEHAVDEGYRVCVLDPIKSDWWGLTSSASGKRAGLPFTILGGPRGHVPLHANSGKVIGELVAGAKLPLSIIDMANFRAGEHQKFFIDFADTLMRKMKGVLYLVVEEAHEFAPKERSGIGNESMAIYWAKKLATAGRSKGVRMIVATQRVQALHNALLGSCETMIVHRMTAPADQEPVKKWLKANVSDKDVVAEIDAGMAKLPTGSAWVCSGDADFFSPVKFPLFRTFDNSAAPKKGGSSHDVTMAGVDHDALRDMIGHAVEEAEANDPAKLRARVSDLQKQLREAEAKTGIDPKMVAQAEERGRRNGRMEMRAKIAGTLRTFTAKLEAGTEFNGVDPVIVRDHAAEAMARAAGVSPGKAQVLVSKGHAADRKYPANGMVKSHATVVSEARGHAPIGKLDGGQLKILEALASCAALGDRAPTRTKVGVFAGYTATGGRFGNLLGSLRTAGLVSYQGDTVSLTDEGAAAAPEPDLSVPVRQRLAPLLGPSEGKILDAIPLDGTPIARAAVAEATGYEPTGGRFGNLLGRLRTLGLVEYPDAQTVAATPWLAG